VREKRKIKFLYKCETVTFSTFHHTGMHLQTIEVLNEITISGVGENYG